MKFVSEQYITEKLEVVDQSKQHDLIRYTALPYKYNPEENQIKKALKNDHDHISYMYGSMLPDKMRATSNDDFYVKSRRQDVSATINKGMISPEFTSGIKDAARPEGKNKQFQKIYNKQQHKQRENID